jgi:hypothetical protein
MTTPYTAINVPDIYESAKGYLDLADDIHNARTDLDNNLPDPTEAFGDDEYGHKVIPTILAAKKQSDDLYTGVHGMIISGGKNLVITGQQFGKSNNVNEDLVKAFSVNP